MRSTAIMRRHEGRRMKRLRLKLHLSQEAMAQLMGIHRTTVTMIETAKKYPQYATLRKLEVLEVKYRVKWAGIKFENGGQ